LPARNFKFFNEGSFRRTRNYRFCEKELASRRNEFPKRLWSLGSRLNSSSSIVLVLEFSGILASNAPIPFSGSRLELLRSRQRIRARERRQGRERLKSSGEGPRTPHRRSRTRSARTAICSADQHPPNPVLIVLASQGGSRLPSVPNNLTKVCAV
jgi:hypothetical protein